MFSGAVILLGRTNMFRFNHPKEAAKLREKRKVSGMSSPGAGWIGVGWWVHTDSNTVTSRSTQPPVRSDARQFPSGNDWHVQ